MTEPVDVLIGKRIFWRRSISGITRTELANQIGTTRQQIQRYETAENKIPASRLWAIARALNTSISFFYEDTPSHDFIEAEERGVNYDRDAAQIISSYQSLTENQRTTIYELALALANVGLEN